MQRSTDSTILEHKLPSLASTDVWDVGWRQSLKQGNRCHPKTIISTRRSKVISVGDLLFMRIISRSSNRRLWL
jgi:hypothetical protein